MKKILLFAFLFSFTKTFSQTTITLQPGAAGKDTYADSYYPTADISNEPEWNAQAWTVSSNPSVQRAYIQFDLSSIPVGASIVSATLTLFNNPNSVNGFQNGEHSHYTGSNAAWLQRVTSAWNESTLNWNNQPTTSTTNQLTLAQDTTPHQNYALNVTQHIQDMVSNPATNHGFCLRLQTESYYRCLVFASSDHPNAALHPKLVITYTDDCNTVILQPGSTTAKDTYTDSYNPNADESSIPEWNASAWTASGNPSIQRAYIQFDLSSIPTGSTIVSASLTLFNNPNSVNGLQNGEHSHLTGSNAAWLQRVTSAWIDSTLNWNNQPTTTATNQVALPQDTTPHQNYVVNVTQHIQNMVDSPSTNHGFSLKLQNETAYRCLLFASSDHPNAALHPKLEVCYASGIGVAEVSGNGQINIYPNPSNGAFTIEAIGELEIYNLLGEMVYYALLKNQSSEINLDAPSGIYFVKVSDGEKVVTQKLVVE